MRRVVTVLSTAVIGAGLVACSASSARPEPTTPSPAASSPLSLSCSDSAGQQGQGGETVIGGVEGLVLPGSDDPGSLYPIGSAAGGTRYLIYKAFLAVAASAALLAASRSRIRLPVCGPRYTGFTGGVLVAGPGCVTFEVSSAVARAATVTVPIGTATC